MLLKIQRYHIHLHYHPAKKLIMAGTSFKAYNPRGEEQMSIEEIALLQTSDSEQTAETRMIASSLTLKLITYATSEPSYVRLKEKILMIWRQSTKDLSADDFIGGFIGCSCSCTSRSETN